MVAFAAPFTLVALLVSSSLAQSRSIYRREPSLSEDIDARQFDDELLLTRSFDADLQEREPFGIGMAFRAVKKLFHIGHHAHNAASSNNNNNNHKRSVEDDELLERRDEDLEEYQRDIDEDVVEREFYDELD